jgi:hypothetical protein
LVVFCFLIFRHDGSKHQRVDSTQHQHQHQQLNSWK